MMCTSVRRRGSRTSTSERWSFNFLQRIIAALKKHCAIVRVGCFRKRKIPKCHKRGSTQTSRRDKELRNALEGRKKMKESETTLNTFTDAITLGTQRHVDTLSFDQAPLLNLDCVSLPTETWR